MAGFAAVSGVIVLAFPITMIVENFCLHYQTGVAGAASRKAAVAAAVAAEQAPPMGKRRDRGKSAAT